MPSEPQPRPVDENGFPIVHKLVRSLVSTQGKDGADAPLTELKDKVLIFTHVPKCAGRTFSALLDKWFQCFVKDPKLGLYATGTIYSQFLGPGKGNAVEQLKGVSPNLRYLRGHLPYGVHSHLSLEPVYITFLRDPVQRSLSHFAFGVDRGGWSADTPYAEVMAAGGILDNPMTRQLAGLSQPSEPCTEETYDLAKENLSKFSFVGLVEQFDKSLQVFLSRFGLPSVVYLDRGRSKPVELPNTLADQVRQTVHFDERLYLSVTLPDINGQTAPDLWVDQTVISVEPEPGQPVPFSGLSLIRSTLAERNFDLVEPLAQTE